VFSDSEKVKILLLIQELPQSLSEIKANTRNGAFDHLNTDNLLEFLINELIYSKKRIIRDQALVIAMNLKTSDYFLSHFQKLIKSENSGYRNIAIHGLVDRGGDLRAIDDLVYIAKSDKVTPNRTTAIEALGLIANKDVINILDDIITRDHKDDGNGYTPSGLAKWAKLEILRRSDSSENILN
jgi:HEAT repeat protein